MKFKPGDIVKVKYTDEWQRLGIIQNVHTESVVIRFFKFQFRKSHYGSFLFKDVELANNLSKLERLVYEVPNGN